MGEKVIYGSQNLTFVLKKKSLYYFWYINSKNFFKKVDQPQIVNSNYKTIWLYYYVSKMYFDCWE